CENILDRVVQNMAERQHTRDIRRRHHDRKRRLRRLGIRDKIAILQPALVPLRFNGIRIVPFRKFSHREQSSESAECLQLANRTPAPCCLSRREKNEVRDRSCWSIEPSPYPLPLKGRGDPSCGLWSMP